MRSSHLSGLREPSQHFSNFFNAYSKAINADYHRTGALFQRPFGRVTTTSDPQLFQMIAYIHQNPQKHGITSDFRIWQYSSYQIILSTDTSLINRDEVLEWFGGRQPFEAFHQTSINAPNATEIAPDDE